MPCASSGRHNVRYEIQFINADASAASFTVCGSEKVYYRALSPISCRGGKAVRPGLPAEAIRLLGSSTQLDLVNL